MNDFQVSQFEKNGFLVIPDFFANYEELHRRAIELIDELDVSTLTHLTKFTSDDHDHGDKISFFFEEGAFDQHEILKTNKNNAINKIGHGLHLLDPLFQKFSTSLDLKTIAKNVGFKTPCILQSMIICKQPRIGGAVNAHQDSTFLYTKPKSAMGCWFALEDCTPENGCMYFAPGSHKKYPLTKRFVRNASNNGTVMVNENDLSIYSKVDCEPQDDEYVCAPTPKGSLVLIHGEVFHKSSHNLSDKSRFIYTFHMIEGNNEYDSRNWLQPTVENPFMKL